MLTQKTKRQEEKRERGVGVAGGRREGEREIESAHE